MHRKALILLLLLGILTGGCFAAPEVAAPSCVLMDAATGTVLYEKNADEKLAPASVTKVMTLLLVMEAIDRGQLGWDDTVIASSTAAAKGGSQVYLEEGEEMSLREMVKCVVVSSANDCACALAEAVSGSESTFVELMNSRAAELGMADTHYVNATGYPQEGQYTTARDVCTLCCEVSKHPMYTQYSSVWIDKLTHPGGRVTDLTNTNRLVRFYQGCDGFKTGSTDAARYCLAATATKNGMRLVAIVLGTPVSQTRFDEARAMLDYGFANYQRVAVANKGDLLGESIPVKGGAADSVALAMGSGLSMLLKNGQQSGLRLELSLPESVQAPVTEGDVIGTVNVLMNGQVIAKLYCVAAANVPRPGFIEGLYRILENWR